MTDLSHALLWLLLSYLLGGMALPLMLGAFPDNPRLGWGLSKTAGLLVAGWFVLLLCSVTPLPFDTPTLIVILAAGAVFALGLAWRQATSLRMWATQAQAPLQEALFVGAFGAYLLFRGFNPDILTGEKLSDAMYLSSLLHHVELPPPDLWLAGEPVNYYYFGYLLCALVAKVWGTPLGIAFNLSLGLLFALCVSGISALVLDWTKAKPRKTQLIWVGTALALELVLGNLAAALRLLHRPAEVLASLWSTIGMGATRVLTFSNHPAPGAAISEFPSFSFMFADLHPHLIALPFSFLYLGGAYLLAQGLRTRLAFWVLMAVTIGAFGSMNAWEMPIAAMVLTTAGCVAALASARPAWGCLRAIGVVALVGTLGFVAFYPFHHHYVAPQAAKGVHLVLDSRTTLASWLQHIGLFAFIGATWLLMRVRHHWSVIEAWKPLQRGLAASLLVLISLTAALQASPLLWGVLSALMAIAYLLFRDRDLDARLVLLFLGLALGLVLAAEVLMIHDRSNTIFKLYMPVWTLFVLGCTMALPHLQEQLSPTARILWRTAFGCLIVLAAVFPLLSGTAWYDGYRHWRGLDGEHFLETQRPEESRALAWLRLQPPGGLLELSGASWSEANRLGVFSGRDTWIGWRDHERLWHEGAPLSREVERRMHLTEAIFESGDVKALEQVLEMSGARYVVVFKEQHPVASKVLNQRLRLAFSSSDLMIFSTLAPE